MKYRNNGIKVSKETIKRQIKKIGYTYRRLKNNREKTPNIELVDKAKKDINNFTEEETRKFIYLLL